jgi:hypothetical protein
MDREHRYTLVIRDETEGREICRAEFEATEKATATLIYAIAHDFGGMDDPKTQAKVLE